ncbi:MAG TPA: urea carboxylase-associated family protein [Pseudomonas sp.]|uniref:urea carboxylase-associated family protein n=1 Tax=Pseudomonas sp. TaxID=306 RepID=UPI002ED865F1
MSVIPSPTLTIPAGHGKAVRLKAGQSVRVINTHGTQVVDCWAWNAYDLQEFMCMEATRVWTQHLNPVVGDSFVTSARQPILTLVEDTSPGVHDTFMAACDRRRYECSAAPTTTATAAITCLRACLNWA